MFRLVLIHHLVLSLLVGPMLCCCTTARVAGETGAQSGIGSTGAKPGQKHCCGEQKSKEPSRSAPGEKPSDPGQCPCKDAPAKAVTIPEAPLASAHTFALLTAGFATFDLPVTLDLLSAERSAPRFDHCSSSLSTADLLFAHHNLRC